MTLLAAEQVLLNIWQVPRASGPKLQEQSCPTLNLKLSKVFLGKNLTLELTVVTGRCVQLFDRGR